MKVSSKNAVAVIYNDSPSSQDNGSGDSGKGQEVINLAPAPVPPPPPDDSNNGEDEGTQIGDIKISPEDVDKLKEAINKLHDTEKEWNVGETVSGEDISNETGVTTDEYKETLKRNIEKRRTIEEEKPETIQDMFKTGSGNGEALLQLHKPLINWKRILKKYFNEYGKKSRESYPNRRFASRGGTLGGIPGRSKITSALSNILIVIDTSGSMSPEEIVLITSEVGNIMKSVSIKKYDIMLWDHEAYKVINVKDGKIPLKITDIRSGGNNIQAFFDGLEEYKLNPKLIIFFTDGQWGNMQTSTKFANGGKNFIWAHLYSGNPRSNANDSSVFGTSDGKGGTDNIPFGKILPLDFRKFINELKNK